MKNKVAFKIAASTLVLGITMVGCKPAGSNYRPAKLSENAVQDDRDAAKVYARAQSAVQQNNLAAALKLAERTVALSPRDVGYRMLLGDLYLKNGRFVSAENAFTDVLTLDQTNERASLSLALALIAQGRAGEATTQLDSLAQTAAASDLGLAYALAGHAERAIGMLEPAARAPGADGRVRQNLALAYAIAGDWEKARVTAAQDVSPAELGGRLQQWADFTNPASRHLQVATLLGVTPVEDAGQPVHLALAPVAPEQPVYAEAEAAAPVALAEAAAPVALAEVELPAPVEAPVQVASQSAEASAYEPPVHGDVFAAPLELAEVEVPAAQDQSKIETISKVQFASAVQSLVETPAAAEKPRIAPTPVRAFVPVKAEARRGTGRYVVQIGAYRNAMQVEKAWAQAIRRYRFAREPMSTTVQIPGKGTFHRLAIAGFQTPGEASKRCGEIRAKGGACFVRVTAGDAPVQWASRYNSRRA